VNSHAVFQVASQKGKVAPSHDDRENAGEMKTEGGW
jgi:hypothetical protein